MSAVGPLIVKGIFAGLGVWGRIQAFSRPNLFLMNC